MFGRIRVWGVLLLATILAHALLPIAPPTVKTSGSPFSASTLDVSIAPDRKAQVSEARQVPADAGGEIDIPAVSQSVAPPAAPSLPMTRGPPAAILVAPDDPYPAGASLSRAPPLS